MTNITPSDSAKPKKDLKEEIDSFLTENCVFPDKLPPIGARGAEAIGNAAASLNSVGAVKFGERLIQQGLINQAQLEQAIRYQEENGGRLGDVLVSLGFVSKADYERIPALNDPKPNLGTILVNEGAISKEQLERALVFQRKSGGLLGDILLTLGMTTPDKVYRSLATQKQLGRIGKKYDFNEAKKLPFNIARKYQTCVINKQSDRYILAVVRELSPEQLQEVGSFLGTQVEQVLADQHEIDSFLNMTYGYELTDESVNSLINTMPENSAVETFTVPQRLTFLAVLVLTILGFIYYPFFTLFIVNAAVQLLYLAIAGFKMHILTVGIDKGTQLRIPKTEIHLLDEKELPIYTVLIPMYQEKREVVSNLLNHLDKLDYPKQKLDVRLLLEEDDRETIEAINSYQLPYYCTPIIVPHSEPRTKPKACNYGLIRARGDYVVIYDAEDRPEYDQLKKAYLAFKELPANYICVQAKLNYYNSNQNLLTKWFTLEYSMWFELLLPGVVQLTVPVPLGGTSNHFKTDFLKEVGAWDPYNVTEDADLGIRIFKKGSETAVIDSRTWEEANSRFQNWIRQRSRWIKGYMQTWLVHMRKPIKFYREIGLSGFMGFQAVILGSVLLPLINPFLWIMLILWYAIHPAWIPPLFPGPLYYFALFLLIIGNFFFVYSNAAGMFWVIHSMEKKGERTPFSYGLVKLALVSPIYWMYMSLASFKALGQLLTNPFHWEKTKHGLSRPKDQSPIDYSA